MSYPCSDLARQLQEAVHAIDTDDYHRQYLERMVPVADYYFDIYRHCLDNLARHLDFPLRQATLVDYGGGHGLLSIVAKQSGWGQVIYIDNDSRAATTAAHLSKALNAEPDFILNGNSSLLNNFCTTNHIAPHAIAGMDVIEHIYCLDDFFNDILSIKQARPLMIFTTASNPANKIICRRLHKYMHGDESGSNENPNFLTLRYEYIRDCFPQMSEQMAIRWAKQTRGLIYDDIYAAIESNTPHLLADPHNTCDPRTGSWTERILPFDDYRQILMPYSYSLTIENGWYNTRHHFPKNFVARLLNHIDSVRLAPFVTLFAQPSAPVSI